MVSFTPCRDQAVAVARLRALIDPGGIEPLHHRLRKLHDRFAIYAATCPAPLPTPGLIVTPEIRCQSELYLPVDEISAAFYRLYRSALACAPVLESTPFHGALSWADLYNELPTRAQFTANPARLLEALQGDRGLLEEFLFASFLPRRFYGGVVRYPGQEVFIRAWLKKPDGETLRCLDAACGDGAGSYGLARLLQEQGWQPGKFAIEGWTLDPLEVWAAAHATFPHDARRQEMIRKWAAPVFEQVGHRSMLFRAVDLRELKSLPLQGGGQEGDGSVGAPDVPHPHPNPPLEGEGVYCSIISKKFDLIICNGILGGPIINQPEEMRRVVRNLATLLRPEGMLLAADRFHGGWKKRCPQEMLRALFAENGLAVSEAGEGICGEKRLID